MHKLGTDFQFRMYGGTQRIIYYAKPGHMPEG